MTSNQTEENLIVTEGMIQELRKAKESRGKHMITITGY